MDWQPSLNDSVFLAGHKNTGKSTLARHYINASLSSGYRVLYIELDPGQPQFTPPGLLSASVLHPAVPLQLSTAPCSTDLPDLLKSHWIGETSAKEDPDHYYRCALNLLSLINEQPDSIVTIINTPGWIKGTGLELLVSIISASSQQLQCPLHVCHLGLSDLPNQLPANVTLHLTPKTIEPDSHSVSAADARNLNLMTYFHRTGQQSESVWHTGPLVDSPTWVTSFDQDSKAGISGVFILRESLKPLDLIAAINGTIMALVAVEKSILDNVPKERTQHGPPYFMNDGDPLDPSHSECIGLAIIAGLDLAQHKVHLISPVSARQLQSLAETGSSRALVLVSGGIELPAAAYFGNNAIRGERPYVTRKPGEGVGWQAWHVRRNIGRRLRNT
jgi:polynucleotide 5'-hydroxyl-kinase GRC3/NOL9